MRLDRTLFRADECKRFGLTAQKLQFKVKCLVFVAEENSGVDLGADQRSLLNLSTEELCIRTLNPSRASQTREWFIFHVQSGATSCRIHQCVPELIERLPAALSASGQLLSNLRGTIRSLVCSRAAPHCIFVSDTPHPRGGASFPDLIASPMEQTT